MPAVFDKPLTVNIVAEGIVVDSCSSPHPALTNDAAIETARLITMAVDTVARRTEDLV